MQFNFKQTTEWVSEVNYVLEWQHEVFPLTITMKTADVALRCKITFRLFLKEVSYPR